MGAVSKHGYGSMRRSKADENCLRRDLRRIIIGDFTDREKRNIACEYLEFVF